MCDMTRLCVWHGSGICSSLGCAIFQYTILIPYEWVTSHVSFHTYEYVMSHIWMRSCHPYEWVTSHISCHTHEYVTSAMSHIPMRHVKHMNPFMSHIMKALMSHILSTGASYARAPPYPRVRHSYVWHDACTRDMILLGFSICESVWCDSFIYVTSLIHMCDMTQVRHLRVYRLNLECV